MASKRKRDIEDETLLTPNSKILKQEEVTRSGRVRKKPAKFVDIVSEDTEAPKTEPSPKVITTPKVKQATPPTVSPVPVMTPQPVTKIVTVPDPVKMENEYFAGDIKNEEDSPGSARSGRARKKSAKVLEMEEFEEAEKKQTTKKDSGKRMKSPTSPIPGMKNLPKSPTAGMPTTVAKLLTSPVSSMKIKDIQPAVKVETVSPTGVSTSPVKISPLGSSPISPITAATLSPPAGGKGSVIKLLLSSPAQATNPLLSAGTVTQPTADKSTKKKSKAKEKSTIADDHAKLKQALEMVQQGTGVMSPVKQGLTVDTGLVKTEIGGKLSLKLKLAQLQKDEGGAGASVVKTAATPKSTQKEVKTKKGKKSNVKDESAFLPPSLPSPNVIHVGPMSMGLEVKSEPEHPQKKKAKGKAEQEKHKAKVKTEMEESMMDHEFGLDMSDINLAEPGEDSFMDIDDDDSLMIPEDELDVKPKSAKKKKPGKGKAAGKMAQTAEFGDISVADSDLVMDFSRMKSEDKRKKKAPKELPEEPEKTSSKKKRAPTAYMLWCYENRPKVVMENPGIDFSSISKTLGEMWSGLPEKEKLVWKRKAKKAAGKGSTLITTGKAGAQKAAVSKAMAVAKQGTVMTQKPSLTAAALLSAKHTKQTVDDITMPVKGFGIDPVDVAAHLKIVGESLSIIGMRLQEHRGLIAVQGSLSVLLDSMLCAVAPLLCLTSILPETDGLPHPTHMKNLDNIAYVMPGL